MKTTVVKQAEFSAAHRLLDYDGKCANVHGHNYKVEVHVCNRDESDNSRMVLDFGELKRCINEVINVLDHKTLLRIDDTLELSSGDIYRMPEGFDTTAEHIAAFLAAEIGWKLSTELRVDKLVLWENDRSRVEVTP